MDPARSNSLLLQGYRASSGTPVDRVGTWGSRRGSHPRGTRYAKRNLRGWGGPHPGLPFAPRDLVSEPERRPSPATLTFRRGPGLGHPTGLNRPQPLHSAAHPAHTHRGTCRQGRARLTCGRAAQRLSPGPTRTAPPGRTARLPARPRLPGSTRNLRGLVPPTP